MTTADAPEGPTTTGIRPAYVLVPLLVGCAVSLGLGVFARIHTPTEKTLFTLGFSGMINMKAWLATVATLLGAFQVLTALRLYGRIGSGPAPHWLGPVHRTSGVLAVVVSAPVAFSCLWVFGFSSYDTRSLIHSVLGLAFYGAFVAKMITLRMRQLPGWTLPVFGGLTFAFLAGIWLTSSLWFFTNVGFPKF